MTRTVTGENGNVINLENKVNGRRRDGGKH